MADETKQEPKAEAGAAPAPAPTPAPKRKPSRAGTDHGMANVVATFNNTIITICDPAGHTLCWASAGSSGFKGARKSTPYAATVAAEAVAKKALDRGLRSLEVHVRGPGSGREAALRSLQASGLQVTLIKDVTPLPHNGCRPTKRRRV